MSSTRRDDISRPLTSTLPFERPTMSRFSITTVSLIGIGRIACVMGRPEEPALLSGKGNKDDRPRKTRTIRGCGARDLDDGRRADALSSAPL
jgi:hypothetical protein